MLSVECAERVCLECHEAELYTVPCPHTRCGCGLYLRHTANHLPSFASSIRVSIAATSPTLALLVVSATRGRSTIRPWSRSQRVCSALAERPDPSCTALFSLRTGGVSAHYGCTRNGMVLTRNLVRPHRSAA